MYSSQSLPTTRLNLTISSALTEKIFLALHPFALLDSVAASVSPLIALFIRVCCLCLAVAFKYYCYTYRNLLPLRYCRVLRVVFKPSRFRGLSSGTSIYVLSVAIVFDSRYHRLGYCLYPRFCCILVCRTP